jgi:hypothetical protein
MQQLGSVYSTTLNDFTLPQERQDENYCMLYGIKLLKILPPREISHVFVQENKGTN